MKIIPPYLRIYQQILKDLENALLVIGQYLSPSPKHYPVAKIYSKEKGYGFITRDDNQGDVFVHFSAIQQRGFKTLQQGQRVEFDVEQDTKGLRAKNVRILS